jgi:hypothetical protein
VKHIPAAYYVGGTDRTACQSEGVPLSLAQDLAGLALPTFAFITPDLCHDTHDCGVAAGDAYLAEVLPGLLASGACRSGTTAIFVVWDEYTPMPILVIASSVRPGTVVTQPLDHYALLRTTEELLGLPGRLGAAAKAASLRAPFNL